MDVYGVVLGPKKLGDLHLVKSRRSGEGGASLAGTLTGS